MALRVVFMGTPEFSAATLQALVEAGQQSLGTYHIVAHQGQQLFSQQKVAAGGYGQKLA